ncbi:transcriptional regulator family: Fungal Specific TF [Penicillium cf. griseofulvum]|uniref:Transcriptional regulator family: Fungal Specific TF n=1 Tax=Penicillium cf. griseofulvum TaxID=2972120 RepID=A0A9W9JDH9_9EURO|nr:transcriptional regulator family: Fungal Specific TF [Penicillium cf. griseofulvum]KAJ5445476.1 transcriptional regulator family: Fungal Specific TF [Penicillium cf. griseofulvum]
MAQLRSKRKAPGVTMPEETLNPISCELCRQRKCKFSSTVQFLNISIIKSVLFPMRRGSVEIGLPLGYLNQLEERLAETESALYGALMTLRSMGQSTAVQTPAQTDTTPKHKVARMEEWSQLPLREWPDMERWLTAMSARFTIKQPSDMVPDTSGGGYAIPTTPIHDKSQNLGDQSHSGSGPYASEHRNNRIGPGSSYDTHQPIPSPGSPPDRIIGVEDDAGASVDARARVETGRLSKAEKLSHNNPSLYF